MASQAARPSMMGVAPAARMPRPIVARDRDDGMVMGRAVFHLAVGVTELLAPDALVRWIGIRPSFATRTLARAVGAHELWLGYRMMQGHLRRDRVVAPRPAVSGAVTRDTTVTPDAPAVADVRTARHTVTVSRPAAELYAFWRDFANLPAFMREMQSVTEVDRSRSQWVARAPGGATVSWETEIVADVPGELIAWQSVPGAAVHSAGTVRFLPTPSGRTSIVHLSVEYAPSIGSLGEMVAKLFRVEPGQQVAADLEAFKRLMDGGMLTVGGAADVRVADPQREAAVHARATPVPVDHTTVQLP